MLCAVATVVDVAVATKGNRRSEPMHLRTAGFGCVICATWSPLQKTFPT